MKNQIANFYNADIVYNIGFVSLLMRLLLDYSNIFTLSNILSGVLLGIFILCMLWVLSNRTMQAAEFAMVAVAGIICIFSYIKMHNYYLLASYLCMAASRGIDLKNTLRWSYRVKAVFLALHVVMYAIAYTTHPESIVYVYRLDGSVRHAFFMSHSNTFSMFLIWMFFEFIYVNYDIINWKHLAVIFALDSCVNYFADSNTNFILVTLVLLAVAFDKRHPGMELKTLSWFAKYGYTIMTVFFCGLIMAYDHMSEGVKSAFFMLDDFMTGRLIHGAYVYSKYGWTLFGKTLDMPGRDYWQGRWFNGIACDNAYIWHLVSFGTIFMLVIAGLFIVTSKKFKNIEVIMSCVYILYAVTENYVTNAVLCFPLLFIAQYAFESDWSGGKRFKLIWS